MGWSVKSQRIYLELVVSWLRSEVAQLTHALERMEQTDNYHDEFVCESIKTAETGIRRIRKFIEAN